MWAVALRPAARIRRVRGFAGNSGRMPRFARSEARIRRCTVAWWSRRSGWQTGASPLTYEHGPLGVTVVKQARQTKLAQVRRANSSYWAVAQASRDLTAEGHPTFSFRTLVERVRELGYPYTENTVKEACQWNLGDAEGSLAWSRYGWYRLRTTRLPHEVAGAVSGPHIAATGVGLVSVTEVVRAALRQLLPGSVSAAARRRDVEAYLVEAGTPYSGRAVRLAVAELVAEADPELGRVRTAEIVRLRPAR